MAAELFHADWETAMTKLDVAFRNFANATKNWIPSLQKTLKLSEIPPVNGNNCCLYEDNCVLLWESRQTRKQAMWGKQILFYVRRGGIHSYVCIWNT